MLSAISCYKFHISKDQQENMKFTIICHLATFLSGTDIKSCCRQSAHVFTSRYDSSLLGHAFFTPKVFLHEIYKYIGIYILYKTCDNRIVHAISASCKVSINN